MGVPGPAIPEHNSFSVHFVDFRDSTNSTERGDIFSLAATTLLKPFKVAFHFFKDSFKSSLESGKNELPAEDFWKTTVAVVQVDDIEVDIKDMESWSDALSQNKETTSVWMQDHAESDCLLIAMTSEANPAAHHSSGIRGPDLWLVQNTEHVTPEATAKMWIKGGAGAVIVFHPLHPHESAAWISRSGVFGNSQGFYAHEFGLEMNPPGLGFFAAGLVQTLIEELLGENLFLKTSVSLERACLEVRPLHLAHAVESGLAAHKVLTELFTEPEGMTLLHKKGEVLSKVRQQLRAWRGPEPKAWGARGR